MVGLKAGVHLSVHKLGTVQAEHCQQALPMPLTAVWVMQAAVMRECTLELAVGPGALATSAYWALRSSTAYVAGKLGTTAHHIWQAHSMYHMVRVSTKTVLS